MDNYTHKYKKEQDDIISKVGIPQVYESLKTGNCKSILKTYSIILKKPSLELIVKSIDLAWKAFTWRGETDLLCLVIGSSKCNNSKDKVLFILSNDKKRLLGQIFCSSVGLYSINNPYTFIWSDVSPTGETGTALKTVSEKLDASLKVSLKKFLIPKVILNNQSDYMIPCALYLHASKCKWMIDLKISPDIYEIYAFNDEDIKWINEDYDEYINGVQKSEESNVPVSIVEQFENYIEKGIHPNVTENMMRVEALNINVCNKCGKTNEKLRRCGKCKSVKYCDEHCQALDWQYHKKNCNNL